MMNQAAAQPNISSQLNIPSEIRGVSTAEIDPVSYEWICRMKAPGLRPVFEGQTVLITGGASGIGEKISVIAAELGARAIVLDLPHTLENKVADRDILYAPCDISNYQQSQTIVHKIANECGITKVVLNARIFPNPRPQPGEFSIQDFQKVMNINTFGNLAVADAALPHLWSLRNIDKDPTVAIVGSRNLGTPSHASYTMAKAAMAQYGMYLSALEAPKGCPRHRVVQIHPDAVFDTKVWGETPEARQAALEDSAAKKGLTVEEYLSNSNPMGVKFTSWSVAIAILDLMSPHYRGLHGEGIHLNGGVHIPKPY